MDSRLRRNDFEFEAVLHLNAKCSRSGEIKPTDVKPIRIVVKDGKVFTLDNRRLKAFQDAGVEIPFEKLDNIPKRELFKFTTENDGVSIIVRGQ